MHIILHSQYYPPETGAPQNRLHELALGLMRLGFQVSVLTAMPSYPRGRIYPGYRGWLQSEDMEGVRVIRTAVFPTQSAKTAPRLASYFSFMVSSLLLGGWKLMRADYLLTESPPLFLGLVGLLLAKWKRARWIFNISDLWPESVVELGLLRRDSPNYKLSLHLEEFLYHQAWLVTGQTRTILENIHDRFPHLKTYHLPNGVDTSFFSPLNVAKREGFHVVYAGLHGLAQGLEQILLAADKLLSDGQIVYTFVGEGPEKQRLIQLARELTVREIHFLNPMSRGKIPELLSAADVLVVPLKIQLTGAVPSKLYEAMAMEKPVILIAESEAASIVQKARCGIVVRPGDIEGLAAAILYLKCHPSEARQMGTNGRLVAIQEHDRQEVTQNFAQFLMEAIE